MFVLAIEHIWISGRLNMSKDINTDAINYAWYNPNNAKRIPDPKAFGDSTIGLYVRIFFLDLSLLT